MTRIFQKFCATTIYYRAHHITLSESKRESRSVMSNSLRPHGLYSPWNSLGQNTGVGSLSLFQGIFPTQRSNSGLPHCSWILYQLSHQGSPRILKWVAYPFSSGFSQSRNRTGVSCIAGGFFTSWATSWYLFPISWSWKVLLVSKSHKWVTNKLESVSIS